MKFKIGDKCRIVKEQDYYENKCFNFNTEVEIVEVDKYSYCIKGINKYGEEDCWWVSETQLELIDKQPKEGDLVEVKDSDMNSWTKRIYLMSDKSGRHLCVNLLDENPYKNNEHYDTTTWEQMRPIPKEKVEELTMEEICRELGREIKIKK